MDYIRVCTLGVWEMMGRNCIRRDEWIKVSLGVGADVHCYGYCCHDVCVCVCVCVCVWCVITSQLLWRG